MVYKYNNLGISFYNITWGRGYTILSQYNIVLALYQIFVFKINFVFAFGGLNLFSIEDFGI